MTRQTFPGIIKQLCSKVQEQKALRPLRRGSSAILSYVKVRRVKNKENINYEKKDADDDIYNLTRARA
ncbi:hypothetical protein X777_03297 [Ooceraea biroi]|uniref:Uncharacterized protein n=1 Tax=Ooceraea biroi TaxID=2015173 RepID=A0A026WNG3_OOCBI|nr:hypothetical protein X777_03297 [Ooceraea biroi]